MTRIDFAFGAANRLRMACQVMRRHYQHGRRVVVYSRQPKVLERFDMLLWSFEPTAFVPHTLVDDPLAINSPVVLTSVLPCNLPETPEWKQAWLLNLDTGCPPNAADFPRILEIVSEHPDDKAFARQRWSSYKAAGFSLHAHDVSGKPH
ncbi:MAG: DNA polymerase III subunit chi [Alcaligenaceae bacterium]|nr:DNA polymerase III subunit chi [Alcaligenaceae bacterium]